MNATKIINNFCILSAIFIVAGCSQIPFAGGEPQNRYGYGAKIKAQGDYFSGLGDDNYIDQSMSWEEKLEVRKENFHNLLKREYLLLADNLQRDKDYTDSTYFRRKGLDAGRANFDVFPENPANWNVKLEDELEELRTNRLQLIDSLVGYSPIAAPIQASKAIVYYDCWVQQAQGKFGQFNKNNCRRNFMDNFYKLTQVADNIRDKSIEEINDKYRWVTVEKPVEEKTTVRKILATIKGKEPIPQSEFETKQKPEELLLSQQQIEDDIKAAKVAAARRAAAAAAAKKAAAEAAARPAPTGAAGDSLITDRSDSSPDVVFVSYFEGKSEDLSATAKAELDKAAEQIKANNVKFVSINGHTDRSFDSGASLVSSKKRADAARNYLISKGIDNGIIRTYGFGKTDNLVENKEGEAAAANNRVEVIFKGKPK
jgi:outer membrane protein OmpA-like peptidoglycan-associated protein